MLMLAPTPKITPIFHKSTKNSQKRLMEAKKEAKNDVNDRVLL